MKITVLRSLLPLFALLLLGSLPLAAQPNRPSPAATVTAKIDGADLKIAYSQPSMRGRKIWGGLVPFGEVWRTGANEATTITLAKAIVLGGKDVPAGAYTLWTLPAADGSAKLIINGETGQWGTDYNGKKDFVRVDLKRTELAQAVEQFVIAIDAAPGGGVLKLTWDKLQYSVAFTVKK
jgi:hypothetical protein